MRYRFRGAPGELIGDVTSAGNCYDERGEVRFQMGATD